jgi:hypothetical protein
MKNEKVEQINVELFRLSKDFKALNIDHQKGVLKTAQGLLRIQRAHKATVTDNTRHINFSLKGKNGQ